MRASPKNARFKSGLPDSPTVNTWRNMMSRCYHEADARFRYYGARGISVCERWHDAKNFLADMGEKPEKMTLDRIDNDGNYDPSNCRWISMAEQNANRRSVINITFNGETMCMQHWANRLGVDPTTLRYLLRKGVPPEQVIDRYMKKREQAK